MRHFSLQHKLYALLFLLVASLAATCVWMSPADTGSEKTEIEPTPQKSPREGLPQARLLPGSKVAVLQTTKGRIEFVIYEKDCPKTARLVKGWIEGGKFDGVKFVRRDNTGLVQTAPCAKNVAPVKPELKIGLLHEQGAVGIAQWTSAKEPCGQLYLLWEPWHHLDYKYVVFGRVIDGLPVIKKLQVGDYIRKATLRPLTNKDQKALGRLLLTDAERRVQ